MTDLVLTPGSTGLEDLARIYRGTVGCRLDPACRDAVERSAQLVARAAAGSEPVYGVNTGFGKLANAKSSSTHFGCRPRWISRQLPVTPISGSAFLSKTFSESQNLACIPLL